MPYRPALTDPPHPVRALLIMRRIEVRDLAALLGYEREHVSRVLWKHLPATPEFRAAVALALDLPESVLFDAEAGS
jgi:hypothetical protein